MAEETILDPVTPDNSDLTNTSEATGDTPATDTQTVEKEAPASWVEGLDPEYRNDPSATKFKTPNDMFKSYKEMSKLIGSDKVVVPGDKATPEELDTFYNKLGRPETVEGYKFEDLPEGIQNESREKNFATMAHKEGLSQKQAEGIRKWYAEEANAELSRAGENDGEQAKETETSLRREWGMAYTEKLVSANKALSQFSDESQKKITAQFKNDPDVIRDLAKIGGKFSEAGITGKAGGDVLSPQEALSGIAKMKTSEAFIKGDHPEHKIAVEEMTRLHKMAYPS